MAAALATRALTKRYGAVQALAGVDLDVAEGELVGLLGPNGAGKSTLVKIACGLVRPSSGSARIFGAPAGSSPARASLGYLAELFRFPGWSTADEVLALHQRLAGSRGGAAERASPSTYSAFRREKPSATSSSSRARASRPRVGNAWACSPRSPKRSIRRLRLAKAA